MEEEKVESSYPTGFVCSDGRQAVERAIAEADGYVPSNCTMEQAWLVYDLVARCCEPGFRDDQFKMSLRLIDDLMDGSDEYRRAFLERLEAVCDGVTLRRRRPSYWLKDIAPGIRWNVKDSIERAKVFDDEENRRRLDEIKATIRTAAV